MENQYNITVENALNTGFNIATQWAILVTQEKMAKFTKEYGIENAEKAWYQFVLNYFANDNSDRSIN